ncbi:MAG: acyl-CoA dehydrogenase protein [Solirubrobacterales bacterium]|jgi:alkylation response protein AidB-like acyl-CoA dehydrogenase|nr:acyl-CoA dehydrogenase protein [Solirubrobacterales bacterium]
MGKHDVEMTRQEQEAAIDVARELAVEFDRVGKDADAKNSFPHELVPLYKQSGLAGIAVPKEYGGGGADILTLARISRVLAKGDPASSLAFNMHQTMVGILRGLMSDDAKATWLPQVASDNKLICGPFSEERAGLIGLADTTATPTADGGWTIDGRKVWATLCEAADIISFNATVTDDDGLLPDDFMDHAASEGVFVISADLPGLRIDRTWDAMGMRATGTHSLVFDGVRANHEALVGNFRGGLFGEFEWAAMTFSGVYLGLIDKVYENTREILRKKSLGRTAEAANTALKNLGYIQSGLGRMLVEREKCERVLEATCQQLVEGRDAGMDVMSRVGWLDVCKVTITESAIDIADLGMRLVGGQSFRRGHVLERLYRDARSGPFHPLTTEQTYDLLGRIELGLMEAPAEDAEQASAVAA